MYTILASDPDFSSAGNFHFVLTNPVSYACSQVHYLLQIYNFLGWIFSCWLFDW